MKKVYIDGSAGTTGLRIYERLSHRSDLELIILGDDLRKNNEARKAAMNASDISFLCLPDAAAMEAAGFVENESTVIIDTSTAHRVNPAWDYGFPELTGQREKIKASHRIANPGCHASGFISLVAPLVENGIIAPDALLSATSLTGYSGGGKKMIGEYEAAERSEDFLAPRQYGLSQSHKHLPEMKKLCGLQNAPAFCPIVADYYAGMEVIVPLFTSQLKGGLAEIAELYKSYYSKGLVHFNDHADEGGLLTANKMKNRDDMEISVYGNEERIILVSRFDNLGKGASGAAIQNMNLVLGLDEAYGLNVEM